MNRTPHKCPCCDGWGQRETAGISADGTPPKVPCRACGGTGVLWDGPAPTYPLPVYPAPYWPQPWCTGAPTWSWPDVIISSDSGPVSSGSLSVNDSSQWSYTGQTPAQGEIVAPAAPTCALAAL